MEKTKLQKITGLWNITGGLAGNVGVQRIVILKNTSKKAGSNEPDFELYLDTGKPIGNKPEKKVETMKIGY